MHMHVACGYIHVCLYCMPNVNMIKQLVELGDSGTVNRCTHTYACMHMYYCICMCTEYSCACMCICIHIYRQGTLGCIALAWRGPFTCFVRICMHMYTYIQAGYSALHSACMARSLGGLCAYMYAYVYIYTGRVLWDA
jgi:hypothetical protein